MSKIVSLVAAGIVSLGVAVAGSPAAAASASGATAGAGPSLDVPIATLAAALTCHGDLSGAAATPVLLVPGTTLTPEVNYSWNYERVFTGAGRPWCAITVPNHAMSDIQVAGEYVVSALRAMHERAAGRKVSVIGFSQGGMVPRWALKWWPDARAAVEDVVSLDPSNHGTLDAYPACAIGGCAPAFWQQQTGSKFLAALNSGAETYAGISYTEVYTATDEVVVPNFGPAASSALHTGAGTVSNVPVQSICPVHASEHLSMGTTDPVGSALATDALTHAGPASPSRISRSVCLQPTIPGLDPASVATNYVRLGVVVARQVALYPHVSKEPALAAYARA